MGEEQQHRRVAQSVRHTNESSEDGRLQPVALSGPMRKNRGTRSKTRPFTVGLSSLTMTSSTLPQRDFMTAIFEPLRGFRMIVEMISSLGRLFDSLTAVEGFH